jgi:hypothetical protein
MLKNFTKFFTTKQGHSALTNHSSSLRYLERKECKNFFFVIGTALRKHSFKDKRAFGAGAASGWPRRESIVGRWI